MALSCTPANMASTGGSGLRKRRRRMPTPPPMDPDEHSSGLYDQLVESAYSKIEHAAEQLDEAASVQREATNKQLQERLTESEEDQLPIRSHDSSPELMLNTAIPARTDSPNGPPPPAATSRAHRKRRLSKGVQQALNKLDTANRRIVVDEYRDQQYHVNERVVRQAVDLLDSPLSDNVRVRFRTPNNGLLRVVLSRTDSLLSARRKISDKEGAAENRLELFVKDRRIHPGDSFQSLGLSSADIIECLITNGPSADATPAPDAASGLAAGEISVKVQSSKGQRDVAKIIIQKTDKFEVLIHKYCVLKSVDPASLKLQFDGEMLDPSSSPEELDMDDGDCVDVM